MGALLGRTEGRVKSITDEGQMGPHVYVKWRSDTSEGPVGFPVIPGAEVKGP